MRKHIAFAAAVLIAICSISTAVYAQETESENFNYSSSAEDIIISGREITTKGILEIPEKYHEQNITVIESDGFDDYSEITKVIIPENVKIIEDTAFQDCTNLSEIDLPSGLVKIGKMAFDNSSFVNNFKNWTKDGEALYLDNYLIRVNPLISGSFKIKEGTTLIADSAFEGCKNITDVKIPKSVKYIGKDAFKDCGVLIANQEAGSVYIDECLIRSNCEGLFVVRENTRVIADGCFMNNQKLSSVIISNNVLTVGQDAFMYCPSLKTISIGAKVEYIGENALLLCDSLEEISVADNKIFRVQDGLLYSDDTVIRCPEKKEGTIKLDEKTMYIGKGAFSGCKDISSVIFSQKLKGIGESAFSECYSLNEFSLPDSLLNIGNFAFSYCNGLCEVKLPHSLQLLGHSVFSYCENLESVDLGRGVEEIPAWTFQYCKNIKYVNMKNIKKTGYLCFFKTNNLIDNDSNYDENGMLIIDNCLLKVMPGFEEYDIPEGVKLISSGCFEDCGDIELIVLPKSLEHIDSEALQNNGSVQKIVYSGTESVWNEKGFTKSIGEYPIEGISMVQDIPYMGIGIIVVTSAICVLIALFVYKQDKG